MKKVHVLGAVFFSVCFLAVAAGIHAQEAVETNGLPQLDGEVRKLGNLAGTRLAALPAGSRVRIGSFLCTGADSTLGAYWRNELLSVLTEKPAQNYTIQESSSGGNAANSYILSGEILRMGSAVRIYTRLSAASSSSVLSVWHTDLRVSAFIEELLRTGRSASASTSSASVIHDEYETDSMDEPMHLTDINSGWISRTLHQEDADWFAVQAPERMILVFETSGDLDTRMELYDAESRTKLASDDDGGSNGNALITKTVEAGKTYLIKVWGYDNSETGPYGFRVRAED